MIEVDKISHSQLLKFWLGGNWVEKLQATHQVFSLFHKRLSKLYDERFRRRRIRLKYDDKKPLLSEEYKTPNETKHVYIKSIENKCFHNGM